MFAINNPGYPNNLHTGISHSIDRFLIAFDYSWKTKNKTTPRDIMNISIGGSAKLKANIKINSGIKYSDFTRKSSKISLHAGTELGSGQNVLILGTRWGPKINEYLLSAMYTIRVKEDE